MLVTFTFIAPTGFSPLLKIYRSDTLALLGQGTAAETAALRFYTVTVEVGDYRGDIYATLTSPGGAFYGRLTGASAIALADAPLMSFQAALPGTLSAQRRNSANAIDLYLGETGNFSFPVIDASKNPLDLTLQSCTLSFVDAEGVLLEALDADTSVLGVVTFTATPELTYRLISEGIFSLRNTDGNVLILLGEFAVRYAP